MVPGGERHQHIVAVNVHGPSVRYELHFAPPRIVGTVVLSSARDRLVTRAKTVVSIFASAMNPLVAAGGFAR